MSVTFRGGKLPPEPDRPRLRLAPHLQPDGLMAIPDACDWLTAGGEYPMDGNDAWGDCVLAGQAHEIQATTAVARGQAAVLTEQQVLAQYAAVTGFDPHAGPPGENPTDQGTVMQDALDHWRKRGFAGHSIDVFAQVDRLDRTEVCAAIDLFGAVSVGIQFPGSAMDQFNAGEPWTVVKGARIEGGHAVHAGAYDRGGEWVEVITWGRRQRMAWDFWLKYVDEAWVKVPTLDWFASTCRSPSRLDLHGLGEEFARLTGQANPFPAPTPAPDPAEAATAADRALWSLVEPWVMSSGRRWCGGRQARALLAWATAKGLHPGGS